MALMALPLAQCSCYFIVITAGCVRPSERDFVNSRWLRASCFCWYFGRDEWYLQAGGGGQSSGSIKEWYTTATLDCFTRLTLLALIWTWNTSSSPRILRNEDGWCGSGGADHVPTPTVKIHRGASRRVSDFTTPLFVIVRLALWRQIQSMYANSVLFVSCTFIPMIVLLYFM